LFVIDRNDSRGVHCVCAHHRSSLPPLQTGSKARKKGRQYGLRCLILTAGLYSAQTQRVNVVVTRWTFESNDAIIVIRFYYLERLFLEHRRKADQNERDFKMKTLENL